MNPNLNPKNGQSAQANSKLLAAMALLMLPVLLSSASICYADSQLKGRVEHRHGHSRLMRPAMPSKPLGEPLEHLSSSKVSGGKAKFDLAGSSVSGMLDKNAFQLGVESKDKQSNPASKTEEDREMVIAWERWHKRLSAAIYEQWQIYGNIPGEASVQMEIDRNGRLQHTMSNFTVRAGEQFSDKQEELFDHSIDRTLQMIDGSDVLAFPPHSQRDKVSLKTKFTFTESEFGNSGYNWKRGDYERIKQAR